MGVNTESLTFTNNETAAQTLATLRPERELICFESWLKDLFI